MKIINVTDTTNKDFLKLKYKSLYLLYLLFKRGLFTFLIFPNLLYRLLYRKVRHKVLLS